jgi:hypothetical protein
MLQIILNQKPGPLPISATFSALSDGPSTLIIHGSVWSTSANQKVGFAVQLDGTQVGTAQLFSNGANTHRAVVPAYIPIKLAQGQHTLNLVLLPGTQTTSDFNDVFTVVIDY